MSARQPRNNFPKACLGRSFAAPTGSAINVIFDGPPGPESGRFIEVETDDGHSINAGEWTRRLDGLWALRITCLPNDRGQAQPPTATEADRKDT